MGHNVSGSTQKLGESWLHEMLYPVQHLKSTLFVSVGHNVSGGTQKLGESWLHEMLYPVQHPNPLCLFLRVIMYQEALRS